MLSSWFAPPWDVFRASAKRVPSKFWTFQTVLVCQNPATLLPRSEMQLLRLPSTRWSWDSTGDIVNPCRPWASPTTQPWRRDLMTEHCWTGKMELNNISSTTVSPCACHTCCQFNQGLWERFLILWGPHNNVGTRPWALPPATRTLALKAPAWFPPQLCPNPSPPPMHFKAIDVNIGTTSPIWGLRAQDSVRCFMGRRYS